MLTGNKAEAVLLSYKLILRTSIRSYLYDYNTSDRHCILVVECGEWRALLGFNQG